ncbi:hypothetical protein DDIC_09730 [Desulfovibrio desulfuricans]|uniref:VWFA domain-containing protein n=1 Tax=Desulfovibrio desulfuricans TaxID=876 RepID=A0A4P7UIE6_DESDE|nr:hypothetical protein [Desulfovibrio desulfuricans]QCC86146.1 hypothetical protein DDIC_09730 [Desulfovibrio desulfuricans]
MILVITDGMPDNPLAANNAIGVAQELGFEVHGLGIRNEHITHLLPDTSRVVNDLPDPVPAMFALLQAALLKGGCSMMVPLDFRPWYRTGIFRFLRLTKNGAPRAVKRREGK